MSTPKHTSNCLICGADIHLGRHHRWIHDTTMEPSCYAGGSTEIVATPTKADAKAAEQK